MRAGFALVLGLGLLSACGTTERVAVPDRPGAVKTGALERGGRRLFDGAPPVIPHAPLGASCVSCHNQEGMAVPDLGFAPPSPHENTPGLSALSRCQQCHVFRATVAVFKPSAFAGLAQDLRPGQRLNDFAPPVMPHEIFLRENCLACHSGPAAREEIRTTHPERPRCRQCHLEQTTTAEFRPGA